jgi:hypothetical protein
MPSQKARDILEGRAVTVAEEEEWEEVWAFVTETEGIEALEPRTLKEAMDRPDWLLWKGGMDDKYKTLTDANMWVIVEHPEGVNVIGSKWVYKAKKDASGAIVHHKARLVAQGFSQVLGVDYFDTYAPVAKLASI